MQNSNHSGKVIGALLVGALVGAAVGILFAPAKGSRVRSKLTDTASDLADEIKTRLNEEISTMRQQVDELLGMVESKKLKV